MELRSQSPCQRYGHQGFQPTRRGMKSSFPTKPKTFRSPISVSRQAACPETPPRPKRKTEPVQPTSGSSALASLAPRAQLVKNNTLELITLLPLMHDMSISVLKRVCLREGIYSDLSYSSESRIVMIQALKNSRVTLEKLADTLDKEYAFQSADAIRHHFSITERFPLKPDELSYKDIDRLTKACCDAGSRGSIWYLAIALDISEQIENRASLKSRPEDQFRQLFKAVFSPSNREDRLRKGIILTPSQLAEIFGVRAGDLKIAKAIQNAYGCIPDTPIPNRFSRVIPDDARALTFRQAFLALTHIPGLFDCRVDCDKPNWYWLLKTVGVPSFQLRSLLEIYGSAERIKYLDRKNVILELLITLEKNDCPFISWKTLKQWALEYNIKLPDKSILIDHFSGPALNPPDEALLRSILRFCPPGVAGAYLDMPRYKIECLLQQGRPPWESTELFDWYTNQEAISWEEIIWVIDKLEMRSILNERRFQSVKSLVESGCKICPIAQPVHLASQFQEDNLLQLARLLPIECTDDFIFKVMKHEDHDDVRQNLGYIEHNNAGSNQEIHYQKLRYLHTSLGTGLTNVLVNQTLNDIGLPAVATQLFHPDTYGDQISLQNYIAELDRDLTPRQKNSLITRLSPFSSAEGSFYMRMLLVAKARSTVNQQKSWIKEHVQEIRKGWQSSLETKHTPVMVNSQFTLLSLVPRMIDLGYDKADILCACYGVEPVGDRTINREEYILKTLLSLSASITDHEVLVERLNYVGAIHSALAVTETFMVMEVDQAEPDELTLTDASTLIRLTNASNDLSSLARMLKVSQEELNALETSSGSPGSILWRKELFELILSPALRQRRKQSSFLLTWQSLITIIDTDTGEERLADSIRIEKGIPLPCKLESLTCPGPQELRRVLPKFWNEWRAVADFMKLHTSDILTINRFIDRGQDTQAMTLFIQSYLKKRNSSWQHLCECLGLVNSWELVRELKEKYNC